MGVREIVIAVIAALSSTILGVLTYRRSVKVDAVAAQVSTTNESRAGTAQIIEGLNGLIDNLQEDNAVIRIEVRYLTDRLAQFVEERDKLKSELHAIRRKYGET